MAEDDISPALIAQLSTRDLKDYRRALDLDRQDADQRGDGRTAAFCKRRVAALDQAIREREGA